MLLCYYYFLNCFSILFWILQIAEVGTELEKYFLQMEQNFFRSIKELSLTSQDWKLCFKPAVGPLFDIKLCVNGTR